MAIGPRSRGHLVIGLPRDAFRPSVIFLSLAALFVFSGWMLWSGFGNERVDAFLFVVSGWLVSLCLHEYAHALLAYRAGDVGVAERGYLTLNPLKYSHPVLSIVLPLLALVLGGIGLPGGAVWVDRHYVRSRLAVSCRNARKATAAQKLSWVEPSTPSHESFWAAVAFLAFLQLTASILNFMPIPGVDGGNLIEPWLSDQWKRGFGHVAPYGMLLLIALLWTPRFSAIFFRFVFFVGDALGLPSYLYAAGFHLVRFWSS